MYYNCTTNLLNLHNIIFTTTKYTLKFDNIHILLLLSTLSHGSHEKSGQIHLKQVHVNHSLIPRHCSLIPRYFMPTLSSPASLDSLFLSDFLIDVTGPLLESELDCRSVNGLDGLSGVPGLELEDGFDFSLTLLTRSMERGSGVVDFGLRSDFLRDRLRLILRVRLVVALFSRK